jgi:bacillithiol biosynthesis deacetylase BshB1
MNNYQHEPLDILVFAAHPDDAEIGMGGTIAKQIKEGLTVGIIDLTYAEMSSNGNVDLRQREAAKATAVLGVTVRDNLGLPDRRLAAIAQQTDLIVAAIRKYQPRLVFAPYFVDRHPDHIMCSRMVEEAVFTAKLRKYMPDLTAWTVDQLYYYYINDAHSPQLLVDVTDVHEVKMNALKAYRSQFLPADNQEDWVETPLTGAYLELIVARDQLLGQVKKFKYAEGFIAKGPVTLNRF